MDAVDTPREPVLDLELLAPTTRAAANDAYRAAQARCPAGWTNENGGYWVVLGHAEAAEAFRDWESFSSKRRDPELCSVTVMASRTPPLAPEELDPPEHHAVRRVVAVELSPDASERLRPKARAAARRNLDQVIESGRIEFVNDLVFPVPAAVTLEWLGFPERDWTAMAAPFHGTSANLVGSTGHRAAVEAFPWVASRVTEEVITRETAPRDDALTAIVHADLDGTPMPRELAISLVFTLVGGGVDTTTSLTSAALLHLHQHPGDRARLLAEPELLKLATEEFLRFYPPARTHARIAARDVEFAGCAIRDGDRVVISEAASGRDPDAFPDPDTFVIDRFPNRHLAFGAGIHRCPGSHLARIVFEETLREVLERIPDYRIDDDAVVEYPNWSMMGGWSKIPATFTAGTRRI